jgi:FkbM family methyltransferase
MNTVHWRRLVRRARPAGCLLLGADGASRAKLCGYLAWDFLHHAIGFPVKQFEMHLRLSDLDVTVQAFSSQLGGYADIFHLAEYEKAPGFVSAPGDVVVDAGANVGFFSLRHAPLVGPTGRVFAFEPNPAVFELLERNVRQNGLSQVKCFQKALSKASGALRFSSDSRGTSCGHVADAQETGLPVEATTLDDLVIQEGIDRIDLLKMDVEGHEPEVVLGGMSRALAITRRVVMESHMTREEVWRLLKPKGFVKVGEGSSPHVVHFTRP